MLIPSVFRADGTALAIDDSDGYDALYEVSLPDLKLGRKLSTVTGYDIDGIIRNPAGNDISAIRYTDQYYHDAWTDPRIKELQEAVDKSVAPRRAEIVSWNTARTRFLITVGSPLRRGALLLGYGLWEHAVPVLDQSQAEGAEAVAGSHPALFRARRDRDRGGPDHAARGGTKNLPLIVMPHGGPFARDAESWDWWSQYLAELGYAVVQPNYRGSSGYGTAFAKKGEGEWGLKMQDDLDDAVAWMAKQGIADPKRVCMVGASYGGYAAMRAAQRNSALYRCAVSYAGVSDLAAMKRYDSQFLFSKTRADWLQKQAPTITPYPPFRRGRHGDPAVDRPRQGGQARAGQPVADDGSSAEGGGQAGELHRTAAGRPPLHPRRGPPGFLKAMAAFLEKHNPA